MKTTEPTAAEIEAGRTDVDTLPSTQYLILEVLAARVRLGESFWTFPTRLGGAVKALESAGLVRSRSAPTPGALQVSLTQAGRAAALCERYRPPQVLDHDARREAEIRADERAKVAEEMGRLHSRERHARAPICRYDGLRWPCPTIRIARAHSTGEDT